MYFKNINFENFFFIVCITDKGEIYSFGCNNEGQLGLGDNENYHSAPTQIQTLKQFKITDICCGKFFFYYNFIFFLFINDNKIGAFHSIAVSESGVVYIWGAGSSGQLGLGDYQSRNTPTLIKMLGNIFSITGKRVQSVSAGSSHSACILGGEVYLWGNNSYGQIG